MVGPKVRAPVYVVKLSNVPNEWSLSEVVDGLKSKLKSIIYIHRTADYKRILLDKDIFIGLHDAVEFQALEVVRKVKISEIEIEMEFSGWELASALISPEQLARESLPGVVRLTSLKELYKITTIYVLGLLKNLEALSAGVVGVAIMYDTRLKKSRPFGFASFLTQLAAEVQINTEFELDGLSVKIDVADTVPIVVSSGNKALIEKKPVQWTSDIKMANWLTSEIEVEDVAEEEDLSDGNSVLSLDVNQDILDF